MQQWRGPLAGEQHPPCLWIAGHQLQFQLPQWQGRQTVPLGRLPGCQPLRQAERAHQRSIQEPMQHQRGPVVRTTKAGRHLLDAGQRLE